MSFRLYIKRRINQIFLVIVISLLIPINSAQLYYYTLASADFLSPDLNFETYDQDYLSAAYEGKLKVFESNSFFNEFQLEPYLFGQSSHFFSQILSIDRETLILRC